MAEMFDIGGGMAVNCNPTGRFHGWLFQRHPDGQYVSVRKLDSIENPSGSLASLLMPGNIKHDPMSNLAREIDGCWRAFEQELRSCIGHTNYNVVAEKISAALFATKGQN